MASPTRPYSPFAGPGEAIAGLARGATRYVPSLSAILRRQCAGRSTRCWRTARHRSRHCRLSDYRVSRPIFFHRLSVLLACPDLLSFWSRSHARFVFTVYCAPAVCLWFVAECCVVLMLFRHSACFNGFPTLRLGISVSLRISPSIVPAGLVATGLGSFVRPVYLLPKFCGRFPRCGPAHDAARVPEMLISMASDIMIAIGRRTARGRRAAVRATSAFGHRSAEISAMGESRQMKAKDQPRLALHRRA